MTSDAATVSRRLIPAEYRGDVLTLIARSVEVANREGPDRWGIRVDESIMLKVGPHEVLQLGPWNMPFHLIVDRELVPAALRGRSDLHFSEDRDCYGNPGATGYYASNPGTEACDFGFGVVTEVYDALHDAHAAVIRRAAHMRRHPSTRTTHSIDFVSLLASETGRHLRQPAYIDAQDAKAVAVHGVCVYAIRHGDALEEDWRQGDQFSFTEGRSWARAAKELALARRGQAALPVVFADACATSHLIFRGQIDDIRLVSAGGKPQTTVVASHLEKLAKPPLKTQLTVANTGRRIPAGYIRSYVICRTPRWLSSAEVVLPESPPEMLELPEPTTEGRRMLVQHLIRERNRTLIERKKRAVLKSAGHLACEVCGFDFRECYGSLGDGFCEVHHRLALSDASAEVQTTLDDLAVVCANCHRMIHRGGETRELSAVRAMVRHA